MFVAESDFEEDATVSRMGKNHHCGMRLLVCIDYIGIEWLKSED